MVNQIEESTGSPGSFLCDRGAFQLQKKTSRWLGSPSLSLIAWSRKNGLKALNLFYKPTLIKASFRISGSIQSPLRSHTRSFHTVSGSIRTLCAQPAQALNPFRLYPAVLHAPDAFPPPDPVHRWYCSMTSERNNAGSILWWEWKRGWNKSRS